MIAYVAIADFPEYRAGDDGSVWSRLQSGNWKQLSIYVKTDRGTTYKRVYVDLRRDGKRHHLRLAPLILKAFCGTAPAGMQCCHKDGNPLNNRLDNLRWGTKQSNIDDMIRHGTFVRGSRSLNAKLREDDIPSVRQKAADGMSFGAIARIYRVSPNCIERIVSRKTWAHIH